MPCQASSSIDRTPGAPQAERPRVGQVAYAISSSVSGNGFLAPGSRWTRNGRARGRSSSITDEHRPPAAGTRRFLAPPPASLWPASSSHDRGCHIRRPSGRWRPEHPQTGGGRPRRRWRRRGRRLPAAAGRAEQLDVRRLRGGPGRGRAAGIRQHQGGGDVPTVVQRRGRDRLRRRRVDLRPRCADGKGAARVVGTVVGMVAVLRCWKLDTAALHRRGGQSRRPA